MDDGIVDSILEKSFGKNISINLIARGSKHKCNIKESENYTENLKAENQKINKAWQNNIKN